MLPQQPRIAVLIPAYKREEYTKLCIESIISAQENYPNTVFYLCDDGSYNHPEEWWMGERKNWITEAPNHYYLSRLAVHLSSKGWNNISGQEELMFLQENVGLRNVIIEFFEKIQHAETMNWYGGKFDIIAKMDTDCIVPKNWINDMVKVMQTTDADILSPNVMPSNAAFVYGREDIDKKGYRPAEIVGGLWFMKRELIEDIYFEKHPTNGLTGAISILKQICVEKDPKIGWVADVVVEDVGYWRGSHPKHIKSKEHERYSKEVGRQISWKAVIA